MDAVSAGRDSTCGNIDGGGKCWGGNATGQLGDGTAISRRVAGPWITGLDSSGLTGSWPPSAGGTHTCALGYVGLRVPFSPQLFCWGSNGSGQIGVPAAASSMRPIEVVAAADGELVSDIAYSAGDQHSCGVSAASRRVLCWGENSSGQLGNGNSNNSRVPVAVVGTWRALVTGALGSSLLNSTHVVSAGVTHTCALASDGSAWCWGGNLSGQLGTGNTTPSLVPVPVTGGLRFVSISAGERHTCALTTASEVYCWGANDAGQLGNGTTTGSGVPIRINSTALFLSVDAGYQHSCAISRTEAPATSANASTLAAHCWGSNAHGQLGDGTTLNRASPTPVSGGAGLVGVSAGARHTCAFQISGGAGYCWGSNDNGQLGDGSLVALSLTPVRISQ